MYPHRHQHQPGGSPAAPFYKLPEYLKVLNARSAWERAGGRWLEHDVGDASDFRRSALFAEFEGEALALALENEAIGLDATSDLVFANLKAIDYVSHKYGPRSPEIVETLEAVDRQFARALAILDRKVGRNGYVVVVTADHGMPPEPDAATGRRVSIAELTSLIHGRFDPAGKLVRVYDAANCQIFLDLRRVEELQLKIDQIARFLESQPFVYAAFAEADVRKAARSPGKPAAPESR